MMITAMRSRWLFYIVMSGALFFNSQQVRPVPAFLGRTMVTDLLSDGPGRGQSQPVLLARWQPECS